MTTGPESATVAIDCGSGRFRVALPPCTMAGDQVEIVFRPEDAAIHFAPVDGDDLVQGIVERLSFQGGTIVRTVLHRGFVPAGIMSEIEKISA